MFFGHMVPGVVSAAIARTTIPFGTLRIWNNGASYEWVYKNNWYGFDEAMKSSGRYQLLYVLAGELTLTLPAMPDWRAFVREAVDRAAGRIAIWEPMNEPAYITSGATGKLALAGEIYEYAGVTHDIIKTGDKNAIVLTPSFNEMGRAFERDFAQGYIDLMAAMGNLADAIAFHSYSGDAYQDLQILGSMQNPHSMDLPVYLTETVTTTAMLQKLANAGVVRCVVQNSQIEGEDDLDASQGKGLAWTQNYNAMLAPMIPQEAATRKGCSPLRLFQR